MYDSCPDEVIACVDPGLLGYAGRLRVGVHVLCHDDSEEGARRHPPRRAPSRAFAMPPFEAVTLCRSD